MEYVTAPWREIYVRKICPSAKECIFCCAAKLKDDRRNYILYRGVHNFILLNKFPYTPGHLMIAPYRHVAVYEKSAKAASDELADLLKLSLRILRKSHRPHGFNTGMNLGASAGAGVADHYHFHVIPRWVGDSNFMPLISQTRVVIEDLETTYARLLPFFRDEEQKQQRNKK